MTYAEKLKDPRWQKMRLEILSRDSFQCQDCYSKDKTLHVHHLHYEYGNDPWDYPTSHLITLCEECHSDVEKGRKEREATMIMQLRLHLKDSFMQSCAVTVLSSYQDLHSLFYFLWELPEQEAQNALKNAYYNQVKNSNNDYEMKCSACFCCPACGGELNLVKKYNAKECKQCGYVITGEYKSPVETGPE